MTRSKKKLKLTKNQKILLTTGIIIVVGIIIALIVYFTTRSPKSGPHPSPGSGPTPPGPTPPGPTPPGPTPPGPTPPGPTPPGPTPPGPGPLPTNIIGFFNNSIGDGSNTYIPSGEQLQASGYTIICDAFWINYPYCWGGPPSCSTSSNPYPGQPFSTCANNWGKPPDPDANTTCGIDEAMWKEWQKLTTTTYPEPCKIGSSCTFPSGWTNNFTCQDKPTMTPYGTFFSSLHGSAPCGSYNLRKSTLKANIKLLASIGGWFMGGTSNGEVTVKSHWAACLKAPKAFASTVNDIMNLKFNQDTYLYDGFDLDCETKFASTIGKSANTDDTDTVNKFVEFLTEFEPYRKRSDGSKIIISCSHRNLDFWDGHDTDTIGWTGKIIKQLGDKGIYLDHLNPQFFNSYLDCNIPNGTKNIPTGAAKIIKGILGLKAVKDGKTQLNIGVLAATANGTVDAGSATGGQGTNNPGVKSTEVKDLWDSIHHEFPEVKGIMCWALNQSKRAGSEPKLYPWGTAATANAGHAPLPCPGNQDNIIPLNWPSTLKGKSFKNDVCSDSITKGSSELCV
jgi:hypothetical protein